MDLDQAYTYGSHVIDALAPYCDRIQMAGSIRRRKPHVSDIEIVCIPSQDPADLFGSERAVSHGFIRAVDCWPSLRGQPTGRYTRRRLPWGIDLDLFIAEPSNFGYILALRTGSAAWNKRVLIPAIKRSGHTCLDGHIYRAGRLIPVREEPELFSLARIKYLAPSQRTHKESAQ